MPKSRNKTKDKFGNRELMIVIGIVLIIVGLSGFSNLISLLLILIGAYILYDILKKKR